jgi:hypothetical protein
MLESAYADMRALNERLSEGRLFLPGATERNSSQPLFENLHKAGFDRNDLVVLSMTPDGDETVIGRFLTSQHQLYRFDIDQCDHSHSHIERVDSRGPGDDRRGLASIEYVEEVAGKMLLEERRSTPV